MQADVVVHNEGTVFAFELLTPQAKEWVDLNVDSNNSMLGNTLVVEHRYAENLAAGMLGDGLAVN